MADKSQSGTLEDDEFVLFYKMLTQREDVVRIFQEYSVDGQKLSQRDLEDFLREEQLEDGNIQQHAKQLIERYEPSDTGTLMVKTSPVSRKMMPFSTMVQDRLASGVCLQVNIRSF